MRATGNPQNADPKNPYFISDAVLRADVNGRLDELRDLAGRANRGNREAGAAYHRAAATLMDLRPAITAEDAIRQVANARYLRHLANMIETGALPTGMRSGPLRGYAQ